MPTASDIIASLNSTEQFMFRNSREFLARRQRALSLGIPASFLPVADTFVIWIDAYTNAVCVEPF